MIGTISNAGKPLRINELNLEGVSMNVALGGDPVTILQRYGGTSDEYLFHRFAKGLAGVLNHAAAQSGVRLDLQRTTSLLVVIKADKSAEVYADTAAVSVQARLKRGLEAGAVIFENDIIDVSSMTFPAVHFEDDDQVIVLFREGWRFGLFFDFTRKLDHSFMDRTLGRLLRTLGSRVRYEALSDAAFLDALIAAGWFPFLELTNDEFDSIYGTLVSDDDLEKCSKAISQHFTAERARAIAARWTNNPNFKKREAVLTSGVESFIRGNSVAAIKTLITEIEGILQDAHIAARSTNAKMSGLIPFATASAAQKVQDEDSLFFPDFFQRYLTENIYKSFDPVAGDVTASRHSVGHGAAPSETYTAVRAIQTILTLDQIYWYL